MIQDKLLIWKFRHGSQDALKHIYEKYVGYLVTLATALLNNISDAEDVVHDFFVSFAEAPERLRLEGSLKGYLATCVANRARDKIRARQRQPVALDMSCSISSNEKGPMLSTVCSEELQQLCCAIVRLPYEQREVIILHLQGGLMFKQISKSLNISINTIQSRYRYGLDKLRATLNSEIVQ